MSGIRFWMACLAVIVCAMPICRADKIRIGSGPNRPAKAGFVLTVDIEAVGGNGYHPVYLGFSALGKQFPRDRYIDVEISPRNEYDTALDFSYKTRVKLPEGVKKIDEVLYIPHYFSWERVQVKLFEDGRPVDTSWGLSYHLNGLRARYAKQRSSVGILVPHDVATQDEPWKTFPDVRTLVTVLGQGPIPQDQKVPRLPHAKSVAVAQRVQPAWVQFRLLNERALHPTWIAYSQLDVILAAEPILTRLKQSEPEQFEALMEWVAVGGNLWVYAPQPEATVFEGIEFANPGVRTLPTAKNINQMLDLGSLNDTSELYHESYSGIYKRSQHYSFSGSGNGMQMRSKVHTRLVNAKHPFARIVNRDELASSFQMGAYGAGQIVVIDSQDPFPGSYQLWKSISWRATDDRLQWSMRNGVDIQSGNDNYWMWLIGSVGQPPVKSFVLLNTLFVIIVGPLCYFLFRRRGRLYLLYFFAPALAGVVTISLFAYALASDGTKTRVKVRQVTWLDTENGRALEQSRQTYYAVFGGSDGLRFDPEVAVYPVRNLPVNDRYYRRRSSGTRSGAIADGAEYRSHTGCFLPPRNQVQYLVNEPKSYEKTISFDIGTESATLTNHLPYALNEMIVHDGKGYWKCGRVEPGDQVEMTSTSFTDVPLLLNDDVLPPLGTVPKLQGGYGWGGLSPGMHVSRLEQRMEQWKGAIPPKRFVGSAEVTASVGAVDAEHDGSVHIIMGELP